jgi:hypothetical protein
MHHCSSVSCLKNIWVEKKIIKKKSKKFKHLTKFETIIVGNECKHDSRNNYSITQFYNTRLFEIFYSYIIVNIEEEGRLFFTFYYMFIRDVLLFII